VVKLKSSLDRQLLLTKRLLNQGLPSGQVEVIS
jgi:hypothetical protein